MKWFCELSFNAQWCSPACVNVLHGLTCSCPRVWSFASCLSHPVSVLDRFTPSRQHAHRCPGTTSRFSTRMFLLLLFIDGSFSFIYSSISCLHDGNPVSLMSDLQESKDVVNSILLGQHGSNLQIPTFFLEVRTLTIYTHPRGYYRKGSTLLICVCLQVYPDQALLLLVTGALDVRILSIALSPALPVLNTFKVTWWQTFSPESWAASVSLVSSVSLVPVKLKRPSTSCIQ